MTEQNYITLIGLYLSANITEAEEAQLMEWVHASTANQEFFDEMVKLWRVSEDFSPPPFVTDTAAAWEKLDKKIDAQGGGGATNAIIREMPRRRNWLRYAAAILILVLAGYWSFRSSSGSGELDKVAVIETLEGEQKVVTLPDSSVVVLNERSSLAYHPQFEERKVDLVGEAFFEVTKQNGANFTIKAEGVTTTVLGTSFNVRAYPEETKVEVSVTSGKVKVSKKTKAVKKVELVAGEAGVYSKVEDQLNKTVVPNADAWKTRELNFENVQLGVLAESLERYFGIVVTFEEEALKACHYMGSFPNPVLEEVLNALEFTMDLTITRTDEQYLISGDAAQCQ
jgi:transmembrane sensor